MIDAFFDHTNDIIVVKDNDTLDLGKGHVLKFVEIPNVHWPETMATFDTKTGTLFPCDAFGSFGTIKDKNYDDLLTPEEIAFYEEEAVRYYSNVVATFSLMVKEPLKNVSPYL